MNNVDKEYNKLIRNILDNGVIKTNRTGVDTISIPHACVEFDMSEGFPLLTTKKMFTKGIIHELLWFLKGDTNIKYLVDNGVNIWTPDAFREYKKKDLISYEKLSQDPVIDVQPYEEPTMEHFVNMIKTNERFAKEYGELGPVYGKQWVGWGSYKDREDYVPNGSMTSPNIVKVKRSWGGINQIQDVIDKLKTNPDDRRMIVSAWNISEIDKMALPPCHYDFHLYTEEMTLEERFSIWFKTRKPNRDVVDDLETWSEADQHLYLDQSTPKRKISLIWDQRSVDTFLGLPFNIASYGILLHMFAQQANMVPDKLIGHLKNVHIYSNHVEQCQEQISREPMALPKLELDKADNIFSYCYENVKFVNYKSHPSIKGEISV